MSDVDELISEVFGDTMESGSVAPATITARQARRLAAMTTTDGGVAATGMARGVHNARGVHTWDMSSSSDNDEQQQQQPQQQRASVHDTSTHTNTSSSLFSSAATHMALAPQVHGTIATSREHVNVDDFDDDTTAATTTKNNNNNTERGTPCSAPSRVSCNTRQAQQHDNTLAHTAFDDDDDDDRVGALHAAATSSTSRGSAAVLSSQQQQQRAQCALYTVPFPTFVASNNSGGGQDKRVVCLNQCAVTACGAALPPPGHPTVDALRALDATLSSGRTSKDNNNNKATTSHASPSLSTAAVLWRKGAFYVTQPHLGNGCLDSHGDAAATCGGCPAMRCLRCHYGVVRLQDAAWHDDGGRVDLYLTLRNYYPDWSRLASCVAQGVANASTHGHVLHACAGAAAYGCQCAWLTVRCAHAVIRANVADTARYAAVGNSATCSAQGNASTSSVLFATQLPLPAGERRRPPLWVCQGHV